MRGVDFNKKHAHKSNGELVKRNGKDKITKRLQMPDEKVMLPCVGLKKPGIHSIRAFETIIR